MLKLLTNSALCFESFRIVKKNGFISACIRINQKQRISPVITLLSKASSVFIVLQLGTTQLNQFIKAMNTENSLSGLKWPSCYNQSLSSFRFLLFFFVFPYMLLNNTDGIWFPSLRVEEEEKERREEETWQRWESHLRALRPPLNENALEYTREVTFTITKVNQMFSCLDWREKHAKQ